jgi:hypothetical protein
MRKAQNALEICLSVNSGFKDLSWEAMGNISPENGDRYHWKTYQAYIKSHIRSINSLMETSSDVFKIVRMAFRYTHSSVTNSALATTYPRVPKR